MNLPQAFSERMKERRDDFPAFSASYERPPLRGLRVNTLKISPEEFCVLSPYPLGERVEGEENGFYIGEEKFGADPFHSAGLYYLQEPSAMLAAAAAKGCKKERVLDLCAAPGGKATQLAAQMAGEGVLVCNETVPARAKILSQNVERMGAVNCAVTNASPERLSTLFPAYFDLILVDAPCSGEGMFKKEPLALEAWSEENVARCAARQSDILECAAEMLAGGGTLIYSTCTFAEEEDEWQVEAFLRRHPAFTAVEVKKYYPHLFRGEGHFCARLQKGEGESRSKRPFSPRKDAEAERAFRAFAEEFFGFVPKGAVTTLADGRMYLVPYGMPDLSAVRLLRLGVELGEWDGRVFQPAHALAMAFGGQAKEARRLSLTREESRAYLRGESIRADVADGWYAVCVGKYPLGLGKATGGVVKNRLPKGLRISI